LEADALYGFWRTFTHLPVLAPMGYSRYLLLGGYVLALGLAVPTFLLARYLVAKYRRSFSTWVASWGISRRLQGRRWVGFLNWLFLGGGRNTRPPAGPGGRSATCARRCSFCFRPCTGSAIFWRP